MNQIVKQVPTQRVTEERERRRRREDLGSGRRRNLAITTPTDPSYTYRWVNDEPGRMHSLTVLDDWEVVTTDDEREAKDKNLGTGIERIVDKRSGKRGILLRKKKDYYIADKAKEQAAVDDREATIKRGGSNSTEGLAGPNAYVPAGGIVIGDNRRS